jgi:hypothetical protein
MRCWRFAQTSLGCDHRPEVTAMMKAGWALGLVGLAGSLTACFPSDDGYSYAPSYSAPANYSSSGSSGSGSTTNERRYRETTIVTPKGVTIIQRDRDGTRTIVTSGGYVRVDPPSPRRRR